MAMKLTATISIESEQTSISGGRTATDRYNVAGTTRYVDSTGASAVNKQYNIVTTSASVSSTNNLDLSGSLTDAIGNAAVFTKVRTFFAKAPSTNAAAVSIGSASASAWAAMINGEIKLPPGTEICIKTVSSAGFAVAAGTTDLLRVANAASDTYELYVAGE
jgi:hypothetical protein